MIFPPVYAVYAAPERDELLRALRAAIAGSCAKRLKRRNWRRKPSRSSAGWLANSIGEGRSDASPSLQS